MHRSARGALALVAVILGPGCPEQTPPTPAPAAPTDGASSAGGAWPALAAADLSAAHRAQQAKAVAARDDLFERLRGRLEAGIRDGGPASAIGVCADQAPGLAREAGEAHGVRIGRTSFRLRNPDNRPPAWASEDVAARTSTPVLRAGPDGTLGVLLPIQLQPQCVVCHGPSEQIPADVRAALAARYPQDQATGFAPGELRGWFWVEVPPGS